VIACPTTAALAREECPGGWRFPVSQFGNTRKVPGAPWSVCMFGISSGNNQFGAVGDVNNAIIKSRSGCGCGDKVTNRAGCTVVEKHSRSEVKHSEA